MTGRSSDGLGPIATTMALVASVMFLGGSANVAFAYDDSPYASALDSDRPAAELANPPAFRRGFLLMPFVGALLPLGEARTALDLGYRVGGMVGYRVSSFLSLGAELDADFFNPNELEIGYQFSFLVGDLALCPLFHIALERGQVVVGPKVGIYRYDVSVKRYDDVTVKDEVEVGLVYGLSLGIFGQAGSMAVGALVGYTVRRISNITCLASSFAEQCAQDSGDLKALTTTVAMLF